VISVAIGRLSLPLALLAGARLLGGGFLLRRMKKNRAAVLRAEVRSLAIHLSGGREPARMHPATFRNQYCRVEGHLHYFGVPVFIVQTSLYVGLGISPPL